MARREPFFTEDLQFPTGAHKIKYVTPLIATSDFAGSRGMEYKYRYQNVC